MSRIRTRGWQGRNCRWLSRGRPGGRAPPQIHGPETPFPSSAFLRGPAMQGSPGDATWAGLGTAGRPGGECPIPGGPSNLAKTTLSLFIITACSAQPPLAGTRCAQSNKHHPGNSTSAILPGDGTLSVSCHRTPESAPILTERDGLGESCSVPRPLQKGELLGTGCGQDSQRFEGMWYSPS